MLSLRILLCGVVATTSLLHADDSAIHCISVGPPPYKTAGPEKSDGDTWMPAWTADGSVFSPGNDNHGFGNVQSSNINFSRIDGTDPEKLTGETVNSMTDYGGASQESVWEFRVASHPRGPWRTVGSQHFTPAGYYGLGICPKFSSADGTKAWVFCAGDWTNAAVYRLTSIPITFQ